MAAPNGGLKQVALDIWHDKPLFFTLIVALAVGGYLLYKNSQSSVIAGNTPVAGNTTGGGTHYHYRRNHGPPGKKKGVVRGKNTMGYGAGWDASHPGIPIYNSVSGASQSAIQSYATWGKEVKILGDPIRGGYNNTGGNNEWWPVQGGFISSADIATVTQ
jgi:hypothetical protein